MRDKAYSLAAALTLKQQQADAAGARLAEEQARLAERARELHAAQAALAALMEARRASDEGRAWSGAELARLGAEAARTAKQHTELAHRESAARAAHTAQKRTVRAAQSVLSEALAERSMLERHHSQFVEAARKNASTRALDEQDDLVAVRARSGR